MKAPILVATDGTAASLGALRVAYSLAQGREYPPHVLAVYEPVPMYGVPGYPLPSLPPLDAHMQADFRQQILALIREVDGGMGPRVVSVEVGAPAPTIVRYAAQIGAEMIVLGIGRHTLSDRLFGTETALRVAQLAHVPVLAVPRDATAVPRRALIGVDFSEFSQDSARALLGILPEDAEAHLVHVAWSAPTIAELEGAREWAETYSAGVKAQLEEFARQLSAEYPARLTVEVLHGDPATELLAYADRIGADIVAAGSHGYGFFSRILMGSVSARLLRRAQCSVLICPPRAVVEEALHGQLAFELPAMPPPAVPIGMTI